MKKLALAAVVLLLAISGSSHATYHFWHITQLYSNADATIQFIELTAYASGQEYIHGHTITSSQGTTTHSYTFPADLPDDTATMMSDGYGYGMGMTTYKSMLIGTQAFAALGVVMPDYIVPNGFLFTANGSVTYAEGVETLSYASLPTDGTHALNRSGITGANAPVNFNGEMGTVANYQTLWFNPAESGWGININHQGSTLFATLFTYDAAGNGMWLVMSNGARLSGETFSGPFYRTTGPAFSANPFTPIGASNVTAVGTMTVTFSGDTAALSYSVDGVTVNKSIQKQVYGARAAICQPTTSDRSSLTNYQDLWWNASESGWGVNVTHQGSTLFATLFDYDATGKGLWLVMSGGLKQPDGSYLGDLFQTTGPAFNAQPFTPIGAGNVRKVGTMQFRFTNGVTGALTYSVDGINVTKSITRQLFATTATVCL